MGLDDVSGIECSPGGEKTQSGLRILLSARGRPVHVGQRAPGKQSTAGKENTGSNGHGHLRAQGP